MEDKIEYKISFPKEKEHKSFKIFDENDNFKGSVYFSADGAYISLVDLKLVPSEIRRIREISY